MTPTNPLQTSTVILALFKPEGLHPDVIQHLHQAGISPDCLEILSPLPLEIPLLQPRSRMPIVAITILGGLAGIGIGLFLAGGTAMLYPIPTGGKPIVAPPIVGIIAFETMMLLAIVCTFLTMISRMRSVFPFSSLQQDPRIDEGFVSVAIHVELAHTPLPDLYDLLNHFGAVDIQIQRPLKKRSFLDGNQP